MVSLHGYLRAELPHPIWFIRHMLHMLPHPDVERQRGNLTSAREEAEARFPFKATFNAELLLTFVNAQDMCHNG